MPQIPFNIDELTISNIVSSLSGMLFRCQNDEDRTMLFVSDGCEKLTEYTEEELIQNKLISFGTLIHFDDKKKLLDDIRIRLGEKMPCNSVYRIITKTGRIKWLTEISNGIYDKNGELLYIEGHICECTAEKDGALISNVFNTYQSTINLASIISMTDTKGRIIFANDLFCKYSKYTRAELIGKNHNIINSAYHPKEFFADMWETIKEGKTWRGEIRNKAKDGSYYWVDTVISPVFNDKKEIIQYFSIRNLVIEKKETEEKLQKSQYLLSEAQKIAKIGSWEIDIATQKMTWSAEMYHLCECDPKNFSPDKNSFEKFIYHDDYVNQSMAIKAMVSGMGMEAIEFRINTSTGKVKYVRGASSIVYDNFKNAIKIIGTAQDITEQKKIESDLINQKQFTDTVLSNLPVDVAVFDDKHRYLFLNSRAVKDEEMRKWLIGKDDFEYCEYKGIDRSLAIRRREVFNNAVSTRKVIEWIDEHITSDGEKRYLLRKMYPYIKDGKIEYVFGYGVDITQLHLAEQKTKESEEQYRFLFETMNDGLMYTGSNSEIKMINTSFSKIFGYTKEEIIGKTTDLLFDSEKERDVIRKKIWDEGKLGRTAALEVEFRVKSGEKRICKVNATAVYESNKLVGVLSIITDITESKKAELLLEKTNQNYFNLLNNMNDGFMLDDVDGKIIFANQRFLEIFGLKDVDISTIILENYVAPEYRKKLRDRHTRRMAGEKVPNIFEYEGIRSNGESIWLEVRVNLVVEEGVVKGSQSIVRDITKNRDKDLEFKKLAELKRKIIDVSKDVFYVIKVINPNQLFNPLIYVSEKIRNLIGVSEEYLMQHTKEVWINAVHPDDISSFLRNTWLIYAEKKTQSQVYRIKKFDTEQYIWIHHFATPIIDTSGEVVEIYGSISDITDLKTKELELERINHELILIEENERQKMSYELHDSLLQILASSKLFMKRAKSKGDFVDLEDSINMAIAEVRNILNNLSPRFLKEHGLYKAVSLLAEQISKAKILEVEYSYDEELTDVSFSEYALFNIFRVIQESINNALENSAFKKIIISMKYVNSDLIINIANIGTKISDDALQNTRAFSSIKRRLSVLKAKKLEIIKRDETQIILQYTIPVE